MRYLHTMIRASDLDATLAFFVDQLGLMEVRRYDSEQGRFTLVFLAAPGDADNAEAAQSPLPTTGTPRTMMVAETLATLPIGWTIFTRLVRSFMTRAWSLTGRHVTGEWPL